MPKIFPIQTNFTSGQIDEILDGRIDITKYQNGVRLLRNFIPFQQGGIKGRPGTRFVAETKDSTKKSWLLPFSFSTTQNYVLEFGHQYIRIYTNNGRLENPIGTPVEVATPYTENDLKLLKFTQSADVLYITHPNFIQKQLNRIGATTWTLTDFVGNPPATVEANINLNKGLTLAATSGLGVTVTQEAGGTFLTGDIGRQIVGVGGVATITAVVLDGGANATVDILTAFSSTSIAAGAWELTGSPNVTLTPGIASPVGASTALTLSASGWRLDVGKFIRVNGGVVRITAVTSTVAATGIILAPLTNVVAAIGGTWTVEVGTWSVSRGFPRTTGFYDQRLMFAGSSLEPDTVWGSATSKFSKFGGGDKDADPVRYVLSANQVNLIEWISPQRDLIIGTSGAEFKLTGGINEPLTPSNVLAKPETAWGSESIMPVRADRATIFVQRGGNILRAISYSFDVDGYESEDLTLLATNIGSPGLIQLGFEKFPIPLIWALRSDGVLLTLTYDPKQEIHAWAEHNTDGLFESVCPSLDPTGKKGQTWVIVRRLISGTWRRYVEYFDSAETINKTHPLLVDCGLSYNGTVNSATITPGSTSGSGVTFTAGAALFGAGDVGKQIYQISGGIGRATITAFTDSTHVVATITSAFASTSAIAAGSWGLAVKTVIGLTHLQDKTVQVIGDGSAYPPATVTGSSLTLDGPHSLKIDIGLLFVPEVTTLRPATQVGTGNSLFLVKGVNKFYILFKDTIGAEVNGEQLEFRSSADPMDAAPPAKTEIFESSSIGYDRDARVTVRQPQSLPIMILAIGESLDVGEE